MSDLYEGNRFLDFFVGLVLSLLCADVYVGFFSFTELPHLIPHGEK